MAMAPYISRDEFEHCLTTVDEAMGDALAAEPWLEPRFARSREVMTEAEQELAGGNMVGPAFKIANTARTVAVDHYMRVDPDRARGLLDIAIKLYGFRDQPQFAGSIAKCKEHLAQLDLPAPEPPEPTPPTPSPASAPEPSPDESAAQAPAQTTTQTSAPVQTSAPAPVPRQAGSASAWRRTAADDDSDDGETEGSALREHHRNVNWEQLLAEWRDGGADETPAEDLIDAFGEHVMEMLRRNAPTAADRFGALLKDDLRRLRDHLAGTSVPSDVYAPLHERAKEVRHVTARDTRTYARGGTAAEGRQIRLQWLSSALLNVSLRRHMAENDYQIVADVLGYLQTLQIEYRVDNARREDLLAVSEATSLVAVGELQEYHLDSVNQVCQWVRLAVGFQLLVRGPEPVLPGEARRHARVQRPDDSGRYFPPEQWAQLLLRQWAGEPEHWDSIAFILLILSNWKAEGLERLLAALYRPHYTALGGPVAKDEIREFWRERALAMLTAARAVRVVRNAWEPGASGAAASTSMSLTERDSAVQLPNRLLQGVAVELAPKTNGAVMQGALFADRPVPTFLASNVFGPIGVLKIDEATKVQREKRNFDAFGELLHPVYRSSKCTVSTATVINSSNGQRYQGILTSYVFRNRDEPTTLRAWLVRSDDVKGETLQDVVDDLLLEALGPWLSNASRAMGDLRGEYPALRPDDHERTEYVPGKDARTELEHFVTPEVAEIFGVDGGLTWRPRTLGALFEGSASRAGLLADDRDAGLTNPLWLVAHIAEVFPEGPENPAQQDQEDQEDQQDQQDQEDQEAQEDPAELLEWLLYDRQAGLTTRSYLTCVAHGDLHCENVLVGGTERAERRPDLYIIDFETTHRGHICKDFARLESALWSRTFAWTPEQLAEIRPWFARALSGEALWAPAIPETADPEVRRVLTCVTRLRAILKGCEQPNWAFTDLEYRWALFASLLPFARYRDHETPSNRFLPFLLAAEVAEGLIEDARKATGRRP
ncbi:phosphotransferase [Streptomyces sp. SKN60]|uniref:phosphotransferase n=1 Tax=Streptomyces sp. SKN60 TaxID=2855506 RepID=UPI002246B142|nr:phosphotransferase [Streptomyces sp. SKN60]MCX2183339.1 phosphotransferase [Streptomyces sp. SKN60]